MLLYLVFCPEEQCRKPLAPSPAWKEKKAKRLKHYHSCKRQGKEATEMQGPCSEWETEAPPIGTTKICKKKDQAGRRRRWHLMGKNGEKGGEIKK